LPFKCDLQRYISVDDGSLVYGAGYAHLNPDNGAGASSGSGKNAFDDKDKFAVGFGVVGFVMGLVGVGFAVQRCRRGRQAFARNQNPMATQTGRGMPLFMEFTDVTGGGLLGGAVQVELSCDPYHSLKPPGFNPCSLHVISWFLQNFQLFSNATFVPLQMGDGTETSDGGVITGRSSRWGSAR
jgi:hypothetical protein